MTSNRLIGGMSHEEKLLLLQLLMLDMRGSFPSGWEDPRLVRAAELSVELCLSKHQHRISTIEEDSGFDGRHFRTSVDNGGYEGMDSLHGLQHSVNDKSPCFERNCRILLNYPESRLSDWKEL